MRLPLSARGKMASCRDIDRLAERIRRFMIGQTCPGSALRRYIDETFSNPSPSALAAVLAAPVTGESAPLFELIFFPDLALQLEIEDFLLAQRFEPPDEVALARCFQSRPLEAGFSYGEKNRHMTVSMPGDLAGPFVARLRISARPDPRLADTFARCLTDSARIRSLVLVRNAAKAPEAEAVGWLCRMVQAASAALDDDDFLDHLAFAVGMMQDLPRGVNVLHYLQDRRKACLTALRVADREADRQRIGPMEIILMGRSSTPFVDQALARRQIAMIDLMCALTH